MSLFHLKRLSPILLSLLMIALFTVVFGYAYQEGTAVAPVHALILPAISFQGGSSITVNEGDGSVVVSVQISQAPTTTASVEYRTFPGTASTSDFTMAQGTLTFPVDVTTPRQITIQITNDSISEQQESFTIFLFNPVNARTVEPTLFTVYINDNDVAPTATATGGAPIFADGLEPNNSFDEASNVDAGGAAKCSLTFYPPGDEDYFRWWGQAGISYRVFTRDLAAGIDTNLRVYDTNQNQIAQNNDETPGSRNSSIEFTASVTGFYYALVTNTIPGDPIGRTYCFEVTRFVEPTPTPPSGFPTGADACEFNSTLETACLIVVGQTLSLSFVPTLGSAQDTDMFRLWVKPGVYHTCETTIPTGSAADTNMIMFDANGNPFNPWLGNDDKAPGDLGSSLTYFSTYTGWLFIEVGPVNVPTLEESPQFTYTMTCTQLVATPTPTPTNTPPPVPTFPPGGGTFATPTLIPTIAIPPTQVPTPTAINPADFIPTPVQPPIVDVQPLPTSTPAAGGGQTVTIDVTVFYDSNNNYLPELTEGIRDTAVALFDNATGELLSFGNTNEAGMIHFENIQTAGTVRIVVPFLSYSQVITQSTDEVLIRVAPGTLPIGIP